MRQEDQFISETEQCKRIHRVIESAVISDQVADVPKIKEWFWSKVMILSDKQLSQIQSMMPSLQDSTCYTEY